MKTKIYFFGFLLFNILSYSQHATYLYYIEFKDVLNKPKIIKQNKKSEIISFNNQELEILKYEEVFSYFSSQKLKNTSLIEFKNGEDFSRFKSLHQNEIVKTEKIDIRNEDSLLNDFEFQNKITFPENKKLSNIPYLYTPNDYYLIPTDISHTHLDLINAREAWDYSKGDGVIVGISDNGFRLTHHEFENKISTLPNQTVGNTSDHHGNLVAGLAGSNTDNNLGISSIGFNNKLLVTDHHGPGSWNWLKQLSQNGAKIINMSWYSSCSFIQAEQDAVNELYNNGSILVAAAGNAVTCDNSYAKVFPASYKNVISVSGIGHLNDLNSTNTNNVKDVHYLNYATQSIKTQHNEDVDIVAPSYEIYGVPYSDCDDCIGMAWTGSSIAAPIVSGTLSLLFSSNTCLSLLEAETILKLTSANIDHLPPNQIFAGLLGAGRLDAAKANKMAWQMNPSNGGEVLIENKNFSRWDFELLNSPEFIRIKNESFTKNTNIVFKAKKSITLDINTLLQPGTGKSHYLYVNNDNTCFITSPILKASTKKEQEIDIISKKNRMIKDDINIYPVPVKDILFIKFNSNSNSNRVKVKIFDASNKFIVQKESVLNSSSFPINVSELTKGIYFLEIITDENFHFYKKIIKD
ncbi:putative secreted protein (Por secretion system target) [Chryseobacterium sp. 52]|uniref:S8/S53 family peptidase n=1 Tax=Chryseobacterium sp. 52 TaxID=2035213 RepID=UPI000C17A18F|nr:S8/S53 family peptidase [Chryseobacterium sp. 52]PIF45656.1 putative secreted protein (Por secretion system target) [Chryseobacterium sp. 52]